MELKTASTLKKKEIFLKKLKAKFGEGTTKEEENEEVEDDEDEQG